MDIDPLDDGPALTRLSTTTDKAMMPDPRSSNQAVAALMWPRGWQQRIDWMPWRWYWEPSGRSRYVFKYNMDYCVGRLNCETFRR
jgi:hypothetical protein